MFESTTKHGNSGFRILQLLYGREAVCKKVSTIVEEICDEETVEDLTAIAKGVSGSDFNLDQFKDRWKNATSLSHADISLVCNFMSFAGRDLNDEIDVDREGLKANKELVLNAMKSNGPLIADNGQKKFEEMSSVLYFVRKKGLSELVG